MIGEYYEKDHSGFAQATIATIFFNVFFKLFLSFGINKNMKRGASVYFYVRFSMW